MCPPYTRHRIIHGTLSIRTNNKNRKEAIIFAISISLKLKGSWVRMEKVFCSFSRLTSGIITKGRNKEKRTNNPP
jgi:uncharacterized Rmd1/YagE family protein